MITLWGKGPGYVVYAQGRTFREAKALLREMHRIERAYLREVRRLTEPDGSGP